MNLYRIKTKKRKYTQSAIKNKLVSLLLFAIGILTSILSDGDITALLFFLFPALGLFFAKENWIK
jgi:hypothetical protein